jgi:glycosyltransferase involved in cell wall biosynthesis
MRDVGTATMILETQGDIVVDKFIPQRRSLRVAVVTETYPPEINGVAGTIARVVEGLRHRGHELQLVRPRQDVTDIGRNDPGYLEVLLRGVPIPRYPQQKMGVPSKRALVRLWQAHRPDVVHIVTEGPLGWSALQAATHLRLPMVSDFRTNFHAYTRHYGVGWLRTPMLAYLRKFHNRTACTMVPTEYLKSELSELGFKRLRVVSRGVDTQRFSPERRSEALRKSWGVGPGTMVLLCVGRLAAEKNLNLLISAFEGMRLRSHDVRLVLVGDGPERARLAQRCPGAVFAGMRVGDDLAAHYASADVFLFPSLTETWGNVVPEAMASGLAVMAYDHAAASQLIRHGDNGLLARVGDEADFCDIARGMAGDCERVRAMGARARHDALRLDWGRILDIIEAEYAAGMKAPAGDVQLSLRSVLPLVR